MFNLNKIGIEELDYQLQGQLVEALELLKDVSEEMQILPSDTLAEVKHRIRILSLKAVDELDRIISDENVPTKEKLKAIKIVLKSFCDLKNQTSELNN